MMKITTQTENGVIRFLVEGKLTTGWIDVLDRCWKEAMPEAREIQVEFIDITFVDDAGRKLLRRMAATGVKLIAKDVQMNAIVEEINSPGEAL